MDPHLTGEILAVCDTLGVSNGVTYLKDPQCLSSAKDLVLYLRRDSEEHSVRRLLGESQILQRDFIPIFKLKDTGEELSEVLLRLLVNLTNPTLLLFQRNLPKDRIFQNHVITITRHLQAYKVAFADEAFWIVIANKLRKLMENVETILENQKLTLERILILIRNILAVPADATEELRNDDDTSVHDQVIFVLHKSGVLDLLLFIAATDSAREFCLHICETMTLIFREQTGEQLAKTRLKKSEADVLKDARELKATLKTEQLMKSKVQKPTRNFGGTYMIRGFGCPGGKNLICHKPIESVAELKLDGAKKVRKTAVNRREIIQQSQKRRSTLSMRLILKEFCEEVLNGPYNQLMRVVKNQLSRERGQENDETYYLLAMRFFMEFNRFSKTVYNLSPVSETMSIASFHYVQTLISNYHELILTDKENLTLWGRRAHTALRAYQELLSTLHLMDITPDSAEPARHIQSSIFYLPEYRELCLGLLTTYEPSKLSRNYFCDLLETNHIFLKMLEKFTQEGKLLVRGKKRNRRHKQKKKVSKRAKKRGEWTEELEQNLEDALSQDFEKIEMIPFDAASDTPIDDQKGIAFSRIANYLEKEEFYEAISLLHAARDVWADDDVLTQEPEISALKSIFLTASPLPVSEDEIEEDENEEQDEIFDDEDEHKVNRSSGKETEFDFKGFIQKYRHQKIVGNYGHVLRNYERLSENVLHCIMRMFHRITFDLDSPALLYQASLFLTFQSILKAAPFRPHLRVAVDFFNHFWTKFVKLATKNRNIFFEILFWKTPKEATEVQDEDFPYDKVTST